jgi:Zn-finger nucleic acid-binding protein
MNCPICNITLLMADRQGIEIDYCPTCRGIWLDRGELEKIIDRSAGLNPAMDPGMGSPPMGSPPMGSPDGYNYRRDGHDGHDDHHGSYDQYGRRRKKGLLGELFDF